MVFHCLKKHYLEDKHNITRTITKLLPINFKKRTAVNGKLLMDNKIILVWISQLKLGVLTCVNGPVTNVVVKMFARIHLLGVWIAVAITLPTYVEERVPNVNPTIITLVNILVLVLLIDVPMLVPTATDVNSLSMVQVLKQDIAMPNKLLRRLAHKDGRPTNMISTKSCQLHRTLLLKVVRFVNGLIFMLVVDTHQNFRVLNTIGVKLTQLELN